MAHAHHLDRRRPQLSENDESSASESFDSTSSEDYQTSAMDYSLDAHQDSDESMLGRWPRRLLHVDRERDIFTSYKWEPGNIYGGIKEPKYNVISYTWGRYKLPDGTRPDVHALNIGGVTWAIPRIDPENHFSVADFRAAIKTVCSTRELPDREDVQFVWLDVACIDQENYEVKMLEVGRQGVIFQHAESAFVWLASSHLENFQVVMGELWDAFQMAPVSDLPVDTEHVRLMEKWLQNWLEKSSRNVRYILEKEPWFTSLWTLQEAYLRPFAVMLARDGRAIPRQKKGWSPGVENLRSLAIATAGVAGACERSIALGCNGNDRARLLINRIQQTGLRDVVQGNPFLLYKAASFRQVYDELDRVYGIMQVFGFKLGASKPRGTSENPNGHRFSFHRKRLKLSDLELELSQSILKTYPVQSHLSIFT
ncbi:hypothetical protein VMCG_05396 [Cytospora schulzeri]|uniref:Heterokaryon incompatibility domain-containing protein n=1 Tax=Cytospora schulzeri TaxID=448051 RepID=A0A423WK80_9PEZI|nr:hypothetical protein VMCG_05396 [Valsa malicola]